MADTLPLQEAWSIRSTAALFALASAKEGMTAST
jgi:hypothetical protein